MVAEGGITCAVMVLTCGVGVRRRGVLHQSAVGVLGVEMGVLGGVEY